MTQFGTELAETKKIAARAGSRRAIERVIENYRSWGAPDDAERTVRRPRSIDQDGTGLCGPAALLYSVAKIEPGVYTTFALNLFFQGQGHLRNLLVAPSQVIKGGYLQRMQYLKSPVDFDHTFTLDEFLPRYNGFVAARP